MSLQHLKPYDSVLDTIGWTPLIRLAGVGAGVRTPIYGKAEYENPGGSVKDRIGLAIIEDAERPGRAQARRDDRRGDQRQHRRRTRDRGRDQGLSLHVHDAGQDVAGKGAAAQGVRRRGRHHSHRRAARITPTTT